MSLCRARPGGSKREAGGAGFARRGCAWLLAGSLTAAAALGGCADGSGFRPLYGNSSLGGANVTQKLAEVEYAPIPGRVGQRLRNELIFQSTGGGGEVTNARYRMEISVTENIISTLVTSDGNSQSAAYNLTAKFSLIRVADKTVVLKGVSTGRASFERFKSVFSNVRASEDAENRAARTVGEELKSRLAAYLATAT